MGSPRPHRGANCGSVGQPHRNLEVEGVLSQTAEHSRGSRLDVGLVPPRIGTTAFQLLRAKAPTSLLTATASHPTLGCIARAVIHDRFRPVASHTLQPISVRTPGTSLQGPRTRFLGVATMLGATHVPHDMPTNFPGTQWKDQPTSMRGAHRASMQI